MLKINNNNKINKQRQFAKANNLSNWSNMNILGMKVFPWIAVQIGLFHFLSTIGIQMSSIIFHFGNFILRFLYL